MIEPVTYSDHDGRIVPVYDGEIVGNMQNLPNLSVLHLKFLRIISKGISTEFPIYKFEDRKGKTTYINWKTFIISISEMKFAFVENNCYHILRERIGSKVFYTVLKSTGIK